MWLLLPLCLVADLSLYVTMCMCVCVCVCVCVRVHVRVRVRVCASHQTGWSALIASILLTSSVTSPLPTVVGTDSHISDAVAAH